MVTSIAFHMSNINSRIHRICLKIQRYNFQCQHYIVPLRIIFLSSLRKHQGIVFLTFIVRIEPCLWVQSIALMDITDKVELKVVKKRVANSRPFFPILHTPHVQKCGDCYIILAKVLCLRSIGIIVEVEVKLKRNIVFQVAII